MPTQKTTHRRQIRITRTILHSHLQRTGRHQPNRGLMKRAEVIRQVMIRVSLRIEEKIAKVQMKTLRHRKVEVTVINRRRTQKKMAEVSGKIRDSLFVSSNRDVVELRHL